MPNFLSSIIMTAIVLLFVMFIFMFIIGIIIDYNSEEKVIYRKYKKIFDFLDNNPIIDKDERKILEKKADALYEEYREIRDHKKYIQDTKTAKDIIKQNKIDLLEIKYSKHSS